MDTSAFFKITYGLYVVSSSDGDKYNGHISNTVFQITADPPRFSVATHKDNLTTKYIEKSKAFSISVIQQDVDLEFIGPWGFQSGKDVNKFENANFKIGKTGTPILLDKTIAYIECELERTIDTGTHMLFIGKVVDAVTIDTSSKALTYGYYRDVVKGLSPENAPTYTGDKVEKAAAGKAVEELPKMQKYQCSICGFIYDPAEGDPHTGIEPGTAFEDIPGDWFCPVCGVGKKDFFPVG